MPAKLELQKRLAADLLGCGVSRVRFDQERIEEIVDAITREDIRYLIRDGAIYKAPEKGVSRARVRKRKKLKLKSKIKILPNQGLRTLSILLLDSKIRLCLISPLKTCL